ncbi:hypothetical protein KUCAC02_032830 [Chaenocephalus aceratus]|nr:hypothetical protein KUCAC02_032830 [Chaenocephalus aceratus]
MTEHLSTVIKPASPRPNTQALIEGNAKNWSFTTMLILRDHYTDEMEAQITKLNTLSTHHWQNPLDVASSWARRNLGRRLQDETLVQTAALLTSEIVDRTVATPAQPEQSVGHTAVCPTENTIVAQIHAPPAHIGSPSQTPAPHTSPTVTLSTAATVTDPGVDCPPLVEVETEYLTPPSTTAKTTTSNDRQNNGVHHLKHNAYTISNDRKHNHVHKQPHNNPVQCFKKRFHSKPAPKLPSPNQTAKTITFTTSDRQTTTSNDRQNNCVHHLKHNAFTISKNDRKHNRLDHLKRQPKPSHSPPQTAKTTAFTTSNTTAFTTSNDR